MRIAVLPFVVMAGLVPAIPLGKALTLLNGITGARTISAFTRVFDALWRGRMMTKS
jgi:hypothetical protein